MVQGIVKLRGGCGVAPPVNVVPPGNSVVIEPVGVPSGAEQKNTSPSGPNVKSHEAVLGKFPIVAVSIT